MRIDYKIKRQEKLCEKCSISKMKQQSMCICMFNFYRYIEPVLKQQFYSVMYSFISDFFLLILKTSFTLSYIIHVIHFLRYTICL